MMGTSKANVLNAVWSPGAGQTGKGWSGVTSMVPIVISYL